MKRILVLFCLISCLAYADRALELLTVGAEDFDTIEKKVSNTKLQQRLADDAAVLQVF